LDSNDSTSGGRRENRERVFLFQMLNLPGMERHGQGGIPGRGLTFGWLLALPRSRMLGKDDVHVLKES